MKPSTVRWPTRPTKPQPRRPSRSPRRRSLAEQAALALTNGIFEVSGTRSAAASLGLDRHWRNARTHTLHDPVRWKYHHLGRWTLLGVSPPRHGHI